MDTQEAALLKRAAGEAAAALVESGMRLGLGTGSTARYVIEAIGRRLAAGELRDIAGVPTSIETERRAFDQKIPVVDLDSDQRLDLTIDGADEVAPDLSLIKGGGGALVREKIVAAASERMVVVADESKLVDRLATLIALPVAVIPFGWRSLIPKLKAIGALPELRRAPDGSPVITDDGLFVVDCGFPDGIDDPLTLDRELVALPGLVTSGLFIGLAERAIIAGQDGIRLLMTAPKR